MGLPEEAPLPKPIAPLLLPPIGPPPVLLVLLPPVSSGVGGMATELATVA